MKQLIFKILILLTVLTGCSKLTETGAPKTQLTAEKAFADEQSVTAVLSSIYLQFNTQIAGTIIPNLAIYTDELTTGSSSISVQDFYQTTVSVNNSNNLNIWKNLYNVIYQCNALLENLVKVNQLSESKRNQFTGEALFLRALAFHFLINIYGDVPMVTSTDVNISSVMKRTETRELSDKMISDLTEASGLLSENYISGEKVRANKWAAKALLAKVYLYEKNWAPAEAAATEVIASGVYDIHIPAANVFVKNSSDAILQYWTQNGFVQMATMFIPSGSSVPAYPISAGLLQSFEPGDQRKVSWVKTVTIGGQLYSYPYKYKNRTTTTGINGEYLMLLRLSELYLVRAEARMHQMNLTGATNDLNEIRNRAGLNSTTAQTQTELATAIEQERKIELFAEWGFRLFDLKRTNKTDAVLQPIKLQWKTTAALLPIPYYELLNNPSLVQNPGY